MSATIAWSHLSASERRNALKRPSSEPSTELLAGVKRVIAAVAEEGDQAILGFNRDFGQVSGQTNLAIEPAKVQAARHAIDPVVRAAIERSVEQVRRFHALQQPESLCVEVSPGIQCEKKSVPLKKVGLYVPGGSAPLVSSVVMMAVPAREAGCDEVYLCTPPRTDGSVAPEILFAADICGVDRVFAIGGAQAIAAFACGSETVPQVDKIFGPGNQWVTTCKQQVSIMAGGPAIDMPAGPSEVLVAIDDTSSAAFAAADLLSQAEHGADSQVVLVAESAAKIEAVRACLEEQLAQLSRATIARASLEHARFILCDSREQMLSIIEQYAPEHLILAVRSPEELASQVRSAGSVFIGPWSAEALGDYASGTNHVLPTAGYARQYSSLGTDSFRRSMTLQTVSRLGLVDIGPVVETLAQIEGLDAHKQAVSLRLAATEQGEAER